jgi:proteic killer suppression protein
MEVEIKDSELDQMAYDAQYNGRWSKDIVTAFRKRIITIQQAKNRLDLYNLKSLRLEKLKGKRKHLHSMRINDQYRLILSFGTIKESKEELVTIHNVEDYH